MKKHNILRLLSTVAIAAAGVFGIASVKESKTAESVSAAGTIGTNITVYLDCSSLSWWDSSDAQVRVHYWGGASASDWPGAIMTAVSGSSHKYSCDIPSGTSQFIFTRVNKNDAGVVWNRSSKDGGTAINKPSDWTSKNTWNLTADGTNYDDGNYTGSWGFTSYTVSQYKVLDGVKQATAFKTDTVGGGLTYDVPSAPTHTNYTFAGWYTNEACTTSYTARMIKANTTIYAKFTTTKYTVTKYKVLDGATPVKISSEEVGSGTSYPVPGNRYEAGYTFGGWFTNSACTTAYTTRSITANTNIYAKYTSHAAWAGTVHVDLRDSGWADAAANYAVMFMNKTTYESEVDGWSTYVTGTATGIRLVEIPYSLSFEPLEMTLVRYNSNYSQAQWNANKWSSTWGQTPDISVTNIIRIGNTTDGSGKNYAYAGFPKIVTWNPSSADVYLDDVKLNGNHDVEYYAPSITLIANQQFKIQVGPYASGDYYGNYSAHSSISSNFTGGGGNNIVCKIGGTYAFYFNSYSGSLYITKVEIAEADEWAQFFLDNVHCDATGATKPTGWSTCATEYAKLSGAAKNIAYSTVAGDEGYLPQAVKRYDHALLSHPDLSHFIVNSSNVARAVASSNSILLASTLGESGNTIISIVIISLISVSAIGGYFFLRRRKAQ